MEMENISEPVVKPVIRVQQNLFLTLYKLNSALDSFRRLEPDPLPT